MITNLFFFFIGSLQDIFRNQHRLIRFIEQSIRLCSNQSLKTAQQQQQKSSATADFEISASVNTQYTHAPEPIKHDKDLGHLFKASQLAVRLATPQQLQPKPDNDEELGFGKFFTDHMLKIYYHKSLGGWQKPEITPLENLVMHPAAKVLHYAVEVSLRRGLRNLITHVSLSLSISISLLPYHANLHYSYIFANLESVFQNGCESSLSQFLIIPFSPSQNLF